MGFGLSLIETRVFALLTKPWFLGTYMDGTYTTEDLPFFWQANERGVIAYCDQDASKMIGHIGIHDYRWHQTFEQPKKTEPDPVTSSEPLRVVGGK